MTRRTWCIVTGAIAVAAVLIIASYLSISSTVEVSGVVDHKTITGVRDDIQYTLVVMSPWGIQVYDPTLDGLFQDSDENASISDEIEQQILTFYPEIHYITSIEVSTKDPVNHLNPGDALAYFVDKRSDFNSLRIGDHVEFEVNKGDVPRIVDVED